jgi:signal transduction histidine kinase
MISKFGRFIPLVFFGTILLILANFFLSYRSLSAYEQNVELENKSARAIRELHFVYIALLNSESAQRSYLITGNDIYLRRYDQSLSKTKDVESVKKLYTEQDQLKKLNELKLLIEQRVITLDSEIKNRQELGYYLLTVEEQNDDEEEITRIRQLMEGIRGRELERFDEKVEESKKIYATILTTIALGTLMSLASLLSAYYLIRRELQKRTELEKTKDEFINMASHELKTPITSLKVYTQVTSKKLDQKEYNDAKRYISKIDEQTNKLSSLIIDLLDMSRIQTGKMRIEKEALNLDALIDDTVEAVQGTTKKHKIVIRGGLKRMVNADRYRIYQVLVNLLTNAIKYSPKGGRVIIETRPQEEEAIISVKDYGIGIDEKYQQKIFDRLYQVTEHKEKTFPGLGIGLFISAEIVKAHGGKIWVKSKKNKGSIFYFSLPFQD